jgi:mannan endo-1,4-beta-mannosidase
MKETKYMAEPYGSLWKIGDNILGDPAHEEQGWYGVYKTDLSTQTIIQNYAKKFINLK